MIINDLIAQERTDAELMAWLDESKWHVMDAINFDPDRGTPAEQVDTYNRLYQMAKAKKEAKATDAPRQETIEYMRNIASGDSYFSDRG